MNHLDCDCLLAFTRKPILHRVLVSNHAIKIPLEIVGMDSSKLTNETAFLSPRIILELDVGENLN